MSYKEEMKLVKDNIYFNLDYNDIIKTKENFNYLIDSLNKDYIISDSLRNNIYISMNTKTKTSKIICGSYSLKID